MASDYKNKQRTKSAVCGAEEHGSVTRNRGRELHTVLVSGGRLLPLYNFVGKEGGTLNPAWFAGEPYLVSEYRHLLLKFFQVKIRRKRQITD